jgi:hypothetical protein
VHKPIKCFDIVLRSKSRHLAKQGGANSGSMLFLCLNPFDYGDYLAQSSSNDPNETSREGGCRDDHWTFPRLVGRDRSKEDERNDEQRGGVQR